ncbi:penicillin-binding protein 2 [Candidatus Parcubacteria bacterium]|nr:MAG: penicillin-binding protein 2 [Candidatus Parcubacteria bacterium]
MYVSPAGSRKNVTLRARILCGFFIAGAIFLIIRLYFVQIVHGESYAADAIGQYTAQKAEVVHRGGIFFTSKDDGQVAAAVMQSGSRLAINPRLLKDPESAYAKLSAIIPIDRDSFFKSAAKTEDPYEELETGIDDETAAAIRKEKIPGVILAADAWRFYPGKELAAQTLGFVGYTSEGTRKTGVYGLEKTYNDTLALDGDGLYVNPFAQIFTNLEAAISTDPAAHKGSIITTIEPKVQGELETTLDEVMRTYSPKIAGGIVMDPHTGEIVAIALRPGFDPNVYNTVDSPAVYDNKLVSGRYELGSIMKPLTMAAAIDSGAVTPETTYKDMGCLDRSTYTICNFDHKARGVIPVQQILNESLNVGATFLVEKMGYPTFTKYVRMLGLGEKTGIDLPSEVIGDLSPLGSGKGPDINYATASYGQGISVSPIAMVRALSALANEGVLPSPHMVTAVKYESGFTRTIAVPEGPQVLKPETAATVTDMLIKVYDTGLLNGDLKMEHYTIAAKTGTAQLPKSGGGYLEGDRYLHSFFGYFPAHEPKFIVFLFAIEPQGQKYASATLAHPFSDIATFLINYYSIAPDR